MGRLLKQLRDQFNALGKVDLLLSPSTAVMMGTNGSLVHPGDECRATGGTDGRSNVGIGELHTSRRQLVYIGSLNRSLSIT